MDGRVRCEFSPFLILPWNVLLTKATTQAACGTCATFGYVNAWGVRTVQLA